MEKAYSHLRSMLAGEEPLGRAHGQGLTRDLVVVADMYGVEVAPTKGLVRPVPSVCGGSWQLTVGEGARMRALWALVRHPYT